MEHLAVPADFAIVDHTNFAELRHSKYLEDYYDCWPDEARQDGETWPPFTPSKFPWLAVAYAFDGKTKVSVKYKNLDKVVEWTPSATTGPEGDYPRTWTILGVPEDFPELAEYTETTEGNELLLNPSDFEVTLTGEPMTEEEWLASLKGDEGEEGKSAYEIYLENLTFPADFAIVDHTTFAELRHSKYLEDYYNYWDDEAR